MEPLGEPARVKRINGGEDAGGSPGFVGLKVPNQMDMELGVHGRDRGCFAGRKG